jgi:hypothetical protein
VSALPTVPNGGDLPERKLTPQQLEAVIRRASELQAGVSDGADEGISATELVRIGREIGLAPEFVQRALAEVGGKELAEEGVPDKLFGVAHAATSRTVPGDAAEVTEILERYLVEREWLMPVRRLKGRTIFERARGVDLARVLTQAKEAFGGSRQPMVGAGFELRNARSLDVTVQQLEPGFSHVALAVDLSNYRAGLAAGTVLGGGGGATAVAAILGIAVAPPAAVLGLPVLAITWWGMRAIQNHMIERAHLHLEALLDVLERGDPLLKPRRDRR